MKTETKFRDIICVVCRGELNIEQNTATCKKCNQHYQILNDVFVCMPNKTATIKIKNEIRNIIVKDHEKQGSASEEIYDNLAKNYPENIIVFKNIEGLLRREFIVKRFLTKEKGTLLDFGCNDGHYLFLYKNGKQYGLDIAKTFLDKIVNEHPEIICVQNNGKVLPFKENFFDLILCTEVLEHIDFPLELLKEFYKVLKKGGKICITTPNHFDERNVYVEWGDIYQQFGVKLEKLYHTSYKPYELNILLKEVGFFPEEYGTIENEAIVFNKWRGVLSRFLKKETNVYQLLAQKKEIDFDKPTLDEKIFYSRFWNALSYIVKFVVKIIKIEGRRSYIIGIK